MTKLASLVIALLGIPAFYSLCIYILYRANVQTEPLVILETVLLIVLIIIGMIISSRFAQTKLKTALFALSYALFMSPLLFFVGLTTACGMGDCL